MDAFLNDDFPGGVIEGQAQQQDGDVDVDDDDDDDDMNNPTLPPSNEIDWDALMRDMAPPEWDLMLSATAKNDLDAVKMYIEEQQVPVTHSNGIGQTALHVAVLWGHVALVEYLLSKGADVNAANDIAGTTPLHTALHSHKLSPDQQVQLVDILLAAGAKADTEDKFGKCPADYMDKNSHPYYKSLIQKIAPPPPGPDRLRNTMLQNIQRQLPTCSVATSLCPPVKSSVQSSHGREA